MTASSLRSHLHRFRPRLLDALVDYDRRQFAADCGAGVTVGIVALPLAMAFAIASGVKPEQGIVLDMRDVFSMDASSLTALENMQRSLARAGVRLAVLHLNDPCRSVVEQSGLDLPVFNQDDCTSSLSAPA